MDESKLYKQSVTSGGAGNRFSSLHFGTGGSPLLLRLESGCKLSAHLFIVIIFACNVGFAVLCRVALFLKLTALPVFHSHVFLCFTLPFCNILYLLRLLASSEQHFSLNRYWHQQNSALLHFLYFSFYAEIL